MKQKIVFTAVAATCLALSISGCSKESRLLPDATKGNVVAQYDLGIYYLDESETPDKAKGFHWIKTAAEARHRPAMRRLAEMYIAGTGTQRDLNAASAWLNRYLQQVKNSQDAYDCAKRILRYARPVEVISGLALLRATIRLEYEDNNINSDLAKMAAKDIQTSMEKYVPLLIERGNYLAAEKFLNFCQELYTEYPAPFQKTYRKKYNSYQSMLEKALERN